MRKFTASSLAIVVGIAATAAVAQTAPTPQARGQQGMGETTRAQVEQRSKAMFARMDVNKDGKIDAADRAARTQAQSQAMFDRMDTDRNGSISRAEFDAQRAGRGDGQRRTPRSEGQMGGPGRAATPGMGARNGAGMMGAAADKNGDGAISQAEFAAAALARFDAQDANKDGKVSAEERRAARPGSGSGPAMRGAPRPERAN